MSTTTTTTLYDNVPLPPDVHVHAKCMHDRMEDTTIHLKVTCLDETPLPPSSALSNESNQTSSNTMMATNGSTSGPVPSTTAPISSATYEDSLSGTDKSGYFTNRRRLSIASSLTHDQFIDLIASLFSLHRNLDIFYKDYESDDILVSSDIEFKELLRFSHRDPTGTLKIAVRTRSDSETPSPERKRTISPDCQIQVCNAHFRAKNMINVASSIIAAQIPGNGGAVDEGNTKDSMGHMPNNDKVGGAARVQGVLMKHPCHPLGIPTAMLLPTVAYITTAFETVMDTIVFNDIVDAKTRAHGINIIVKDWKFVALCMKRLVDVAPRKEAIFKALETVSENVMKWIYDNVVEDEKPDAMTIEELIRFIENCEALSHVEFLDRDDIIRMDEDDEDDDEDDDDEDEIDDIDPDDSESDVDEDDEESEEDEELEQDIVGDDYLHESINGEFVSNTKEQSVVTDAHYNLPILLAYAIRSALQNDTVLDVLHKLIRTWKSFNPMS